LTAKLRSRSKHLGAIKKEKTEKLGITNGRLSAMWDETFCFKVLYDT